jgi:hypothetical protein
MKPDRPIRVIKREERERQRSAPPPAPAEGPEQSPERRLKTVVSVWVREHRERSEEYHRAFSTLLRETGLRPSRA